MDSEKKIKVTLIRSISGRLPRHTATLQSLGLKKINQVVEIKDNLPMRGMIKQISYLIKVNEN